MKGTELCKKFFTECGLPLLKEQFPDLLPFLAFGLVGSGSECYGFDDEISKDHDFEPAFCIFIPDDKLDRKQEFSLERAYAKLPKEFLGVKRCSLAAPMGNRHGVIKTGDFFESKTGVRNGELTLKDWLTLPEHSLFEAVNGEVFMDNYGEFTAIREKLKNYPFDIKLKKLAGNLLLMAQSGQYNYPRCISRNDTAAAQLSLFEFVKSTIRVLFLLKDKYTPYYKWCFRALKELGEKTICEKLEYLISSNNEFPEEKQKIIEEICVEIAKRIEENGILPKATAELEPLAFKVNDQIKDHFLRNLNVLAAV